MKIKEITDPTLRWSVIKRLLARVPDRPAGAGNFVSDGSFSEPSRRKMPGRHAAERAAKQVWNEVVDELGSRPFFDDTLVRVHWIGLYTKRGQDLASNAISYIQEHAGVEHADEISATAYLREDLAEVSFSRPMVGVILRGRTTYAGAVDLGTQWSVKLKPEDIERQKGSGTRKLPWYEDEGTIADNMTVDETSWRDHVWGPQYYRTKMPELVVGSWSFDTVLIPQGVMSGAHDDLQRVIEVASSLGCKVVDEGGNRYEPGEKMQITEAQLRRIIRETLLREARITPDNLPDDITFRLSVSSSGGMIRVSAYKHSVEFGEVIAHKVQNDDVPCYGAFEVRNSYTQFRGFGPIIYDIAMEAATALGSGLMSDRSAVSDRAYPVWNYYQNNRPDVTRQQLDSPQNELTPIRRDNCSVMSSKNIARDEQGDERRWPENPLAGVYEKPGMETVRRLMGMGKIILKGIDV